MPSATTIAKLCKLKPKQVIDVFRAIERIVGRGESVMIRGFGRFELRVCKGRSLTTPLQGGDTVVFGDRRIIKFRQSKVSKGKINRKRKRK